MPILLGQLHPLQRVIYIYPPLGFVTLVVGVVSNVYIWFKTRKLLVFIGIQATPQPLLDVKSSLLLEVVGLFIVGITHFVLPPENGQRPTFHEYLSPFLFSFVLTVAIPLSIILKSPRLESFILRLS